MFSSQLSSVSFGCYEHDLFDDDMYQLIGLIFELTKKLSIICDVLT